eukprot:COSAG01_NODE_16863_length_1198_cov_1.199272_3_plen_22_part_01
MRTQASAVTDNSVVLIDSLVPA